MSIVGDERRYVFSKCEQHGMRYDKCGEIFSWVIYAFVAYVFDLVFD